MPNNNEITKETDVVELRCTLDDDTKINFFEELTQLLTDLDQLATDKKNAVDTINDYVKTIQSKIQVIQATVKEGILKQVPIEIQYFWTNRIVKYYRTDTNKIYHERPITDEEFQTKMKLPEGKRPKRKK